MSCPGSLPGMSPGPLLAMGATAEHVGSHKVCLRRFWAPMGVHASTHIGARKLRMHTVRPNTSSTVAPMARGGGGDIPGNSLGQGFTSPSPVCYVQGASGASTGAVERAAGGRKCAIFRVRRREISRTGKSYAMKLNRNTPHIPLSVPIEFHCIALARSRDLAPPNPFFNFFSVLVRFCHYPKWKSPIV